MVLGYCWIETGLCDVSMGKLLKAVQSFYTDSRARVRVGNDVSEWFQVTVGLRQGCVMSPWLSQVPQVMDVYGWCS